MAGASQVSTNRAAPTAKVRSLSNAICIFGCPKGRMNDVQGLAYALLEQQDPGTSCNQNQCFASMDSPHQWSMDMFKTCSAGFLSQSDVDGSDSNSRESFKMAASLSPQSHPASRVPSQEFSENMNCGVSNCIPDADVPTTGCGTWSQHCAHNGSQQIASQSIVGFNQQVRKPDAFLKSTGTITTFVIRNIPPNYTTSMLLQELNGQGFQGVYDFLYQPLDHQTRNQRSFAFVNFATPLIATAFCLKFHGTFLKCSLGVGVPLSVLAARDQGVASNTLRYYTCKSQIRSRFRARPINLLIDNRRVPEVDAYARKLLMGAHNVCAHDSWKHACPNH